MTVRRVLPLTVVGLGVAVGTLTLVFDLTFWFVAVVAIAGWLVALVRRFGADIAVPVTALGFLTFFTLTLLLSRLLHTGVSSALIIALGIASLGAGIVLARDAALRVPETKPGTPIRWDWVASFSGALIWFAAELSTVRLTVGERISWAMRNDISNTLTFAHDVVARGGITPGAGENPAPIPAALVAASIAAGRGSVASPGLFLHDILAVSVVWGGLIMLACVLAGATAAAVARVLGASRWLRVAAAAVGSLLVLSWLFTGYPMEYGFVNTHVILPVLLSAVLLFLSGQHRPVITAVGLLLALAVTIGTWSPLALLPGALLIVHVLWNPRQLFAARRGSRAALVVGLALALAAASGIALPSLVSQREALAGGGGIYNPGKWVVFALAVAVLVAVLVAERRVRSRVVVGFAALVVAAIGGLGILLFVSRRAADPWTYYPVKFSWIVSLLFIVILVGASLALAARLHAPAWRTVGFGVVVASVAGVIAWAPLIISTHVSMNPINRLLSSQLVEDYPLTADAVLGLADQDHPRLLWKSSLYEEYGQKVEGEANIWLIQNWVDSLVRQADLRLLAYISYADKSTDTLCQIGELTPQGLEVHTADTALAAALDEACPSAPITVVAG
ncbi:MAG: hypothetical protein ABJB03_00230 [Rhodoglobus sp.]